MKNKFFTALTVMLTAIVCVTSLVACHKKHNDSEPKYISADSFTGSKWAGQDADNNEVTLNVETASQMILTYYVKSTVAKNTEDKLVKKTVDIAYTFNEEEGTFTGSGNVDGVSNSYSGALRSTTALTFNFPNAAVELTKR